MKTLILCLPLIFILAKTQAQENNVGFSILFYNTENLFDTRNDSLTNDDEYTPSGDRHWTRKRFAEKINHLSKVIVSANGWEMPDIIGLCEVENRYVLERLIDDTPIKSTPYKIIHKESPDMRGIDVALLYNAETFYPLDYACYPLKDEHDNIRATREILHVFGVVNGADTLHIFVNHWPSRYSGLLETRYLREQAAQLLLSKYNEVIQKNNRANVIIVGDFNDQPNDNSIETYLGAKSASNLSASVQLYNLSYDWMKEAEGTLKYQNQWFVFDQIMVSPNLLTARTGLRTTMEMSAIYKPSFLFEPDKTHGGRKLNRTYIGFKYNGGFSDHLPVLLQIRQD
ncbi:MAG TPA: endonuclease/exonuclease/phosphatase family protein [Draconibacterium sp.]|nr:endonuclease/exonuclease/phosphatase family protein [Draconibacterium sp.]